LAVSSRTGLQRVVDEGPAAATGPAPGLIRKAFKISRLADFASRKELVAQTGHRVEDWPLVVVKESVDNAIDACEDAGIAPMIDISIDTAASEFVILDNGLGIPTEIVDGLVDYSVRVSTREAYVSPSRGRQGNALQTLLAMAFALDGERGETLIEARGIAHLVKFTIDPITLEPRVAVDRTPSSVNNGTRLSLRWPAKACHLIAAEESRFLPLAEAYTTWNPHIALRFSLNGEVELDVQPTAPNWSKWRGSDPIPIHWFDEQAFTRLLAAQVNRDRQLGRRSRPLRQVIGEFHGLSGTAKRAAILAELGAERLSLAEFYLDGERVNAAGVRHLLWAMRRHSRAVKAAALGVIGREHFHQVIIDEGGDADTFRYHKIQPEDTDGLPFVVEAAFGGKEQQYGDCRVLTGVNWSASIGGVPFRFPDYGGIDRVLASQRIYYTSPAIVAVHVATPLPSFADRGKAAILLTRDQAGAITKAVVRITEEWNKARVAEEKARDAAARERAKTAKAAAQEKRRRERDQVVGSGRLHSVIAEAATACRTSIGKLTVLSPANDPFRCDTRDGHAEGKWFAEQMGAVAAIHLRGLHYRIVVRADVRKPDGAIFQNTDEDWVWLQQSAANNARWLGYVDFARIVDERNAEPFLLVLEAGDAAGHGALAVPSVGFNAPPADGYFPAVVASVAYTAQPCRIVILGEKSSLRDVLLPIAEAFGTELLLPTGEPSTTMIYNMAARAAADGRPAKVIYFSDFDPSGWQMPVSVARKLQALRYSHFPDLDIEVHRVALLPDQVKRLDLPSTPLKLTEKRADRWRERWGHEQTEIDALAALMPDELDRIARAALAPFHDPTLDQRNDARAERWRRAAQRRLGRDPHAAAARRRIEQAHKALERAIASFNNDVASAIDTLPDIIPAYRFAPHRPRLGGTAAEPLFTTRDDYAVAARKLIASKAFVEHDDH
jgi:DNA topoisomerase VI subunit B